MRKVMVVAMLMATIVGCGSASSEKKFPSVTINPSMETQESLVEQDATQEATIEDTVESITESVEESNEKMTESVMEESTVDDTTDIEIEQESSVVEEVEQESSVEETTILETIQVPTTEVEESTTIMQEETTQQETTVEQTTQQETTVEQTTQQQTTQAPTTQAPHKHEFKENTKTEPTCGKVGEIVYGCVCSDSYKESIPATGNHTWKESGRTEATCSANGSINYNCDCGATKSDVIGATGKHSWYLIASGKKNYYACHTCVVASYEEDNPDWVVIREATMEEKQACLNAINAERAKSGFCELYLCEGYGSQEWANYLAENKVYEHDHSVFWTHDEGCGGAYTPEEAGVDQSYTCLGLAANSGEDYFATDPYIDIGMAYHNEKGSYFYCIRHKITY